MLNKELYDRTDADLFVGGEVFEPTGEFVGALNVPRHDAVYAIKSIMRRALYFGRWLTTKWRKAGTAPPGNSHNSFQKRFARVFDRCENSPVAQRVLGAGTALRRRPELRV
jgi:hypothetical protein